MRSRAKGGFELAEERPGRALDHTEHASNISVAGVVRVGHIERRWRSGSNASSRVTLPASSSSRAHSRRMRSWRAVERDDEVVVGERVGGELAGAMRGAVVSAAVQGVERALVGPLADVPVAGARAARDDARAEARGVPRARGRRPRPWASGRCSPCRRRPRGRELGRSILRGRHAAHSAHSSRSAALPVSSSRPSPRACTVRQSTIGGRRGEGGRHADGCTPDGALASRARSDEARLIWAASRTPAEQRSPRRGGCDIARAEGRVLARSDARRRRPALAPRRGEHRGARRVRRQVARGARRPRDTDAPRHRQRGRAGAAGERHRHPRARRARRGGRGGSSLAADDYARERSELDEMCRLLRVQAARLGELVDPTGDGARGRVELIARTARTLPRRGAGDLEHRLRALAERLRDRRVCMRCVPRLGGGLTPPESSAWINALDCAPARRRWPDCGPAGAAQLGSGTRASCDQLRPESTWRAALPLDGRVTVVLADGGRSWASGLGAVRPRRAARWAGRAGVGRDGCGAARSGSPPSSLAGAVDAHPVG